MGGQGLAAQLVVLVVASACQCAAVFCLHRWSLCMYCWCRLPQGYVWLCHTFVVVSGHVHGRLWCRLCVVDLWVCFECVRSSFGKGAGGTVAAANILWLVGFAGWVACMARHAGASALDGPSVGPRLVASHVLVWVCYPVLSRLQQQCLHALAGAAQSLHVLVCAAVHHQGCGTVPSVAALQLLLCCCLGLFCRPAVLYH